MQGADAFNYTIKMPVGVAGLISPWNLPLYLLTFKLAPALIAGNTVVAKPSEMTSVTAWKLAQVFNDAGKYSHREYNTYIMSLIHERHDQLHSIVVVCGRISIGLLLYNANYTDKSTQLVLQSKKARLMFP